MTNPTIWELASQGRDDELKKKLKEYPNNVNEKDHVDDDLTPLHYAAANGNESTVSLLIQLGADVNARDKEGNTPLLFAAGRGHDTIVSFLIQLGADVNAKCNKNDTPLYDAIRTGKDSTVSLLIQHGADVNAKNLIDLTPLHVASVMGKDSIVSLLTKLGANINASNIANVTPLHLAAVEGKVSTVLLLIKLGADINAADRDKRTPLHLASELENDITVSILINAGADINAKSYSNNTALHYAVLSERYSIVHLLLQRNADTSIINQDGKTAFDLAKEKNLHKCQSILAKQDQKLQQASTTQIIPTPPLEDTKRKAADVKQELQEECINDSPINSDESANDGEYDAEDTQRPAKKLKATALSAIATLTAKGGNVYRFKNYLSFTFQGTSIWYGVHQKQLYYSSNLILTAASGKPWNADTKKFLAVRILNCPEDPVFHYGISPKNGQESSVLSVPQVITVLNSMLQNRRTKKNYPMATALMEKILHHKIEEDVKYVEEVPVTRKVYKKDANWRHKKEKYEEADFVVYK
jgi:ankyrin repeat protein